MVLFEIFTHTSNIFWINRLVDRDPAIIVSCNTYLLGWVFSGRLRRCLGLCVGGGFWLVLWVSDGVEGWDGVGMFTFLALAHKVDATQLISLSATVRMFYATHLNHWTNGRCHAKSFALCNCTHVWCYAWRKNAQACGKDLGQSSRTKLGQRALARLKVDKKGTGRKLVEERQISRCTSLNMLSFPNSISNISIFQQRRHTHKTWFKNLQKPPQGM